VVVSWKIPSWKPFNKEPVAKTDPYFLLPFCFQFSGIIPYCSLPYPFIQSSFCPPSFLLVYPLLYTPCETGSPSKHCSTYPESPSSIVRCRILPIFYKQPAGKRIFGLDTCLKRNRCSLDPQCLPTAFLHSHNSAYITRNDRKDLVK